MVVVPVAAKGELDRVAEVLHVRMVRGDAPDELASALALSARRSADRVSSSHHEALEALAEERHYRERVLLLGGNE